MASHYLGASRRTQLMTQYQGCRSPGDYYDFAAGFMPAHQIRSEIVRFLDFARRIQPKTVMEIGTAEGGTNFLLGATLPDVTLTVALDLYVQNTEFLRTFCRPGLNQVFLHGSSFAPKTINLVHNTLSGRPLDILFIDGDHSYAGAKADFDAYAPLVRPGGLIAFHDIVPDFRSRFGRDTGRWAGDVPRLWGELRPIFAETYEFVEDSGQDGLGIGVGRVR